MSKFIFKQINDNQEIVLAQTPARDNPILNLANLMLDLEFRHTKEQFEKLSPILYYQFSNALKTQDWHRNPRVLSNVNQETYATDFIS